MEQSGLPIVGFGVALRGVEGVIMRLLLAVIKELSMIMYLLGSVFYVWVCKECNETVIVCEWKLSGDPCTCCSVGR